jgi:hypothetical protein
MVGLGDIKLPPPLLPLTAAARNDIEEALSLIKVMEDQTV